MILYPPMKKFFIVLGFLFCSFVVQATEEKSDVSVAQKSEQKVESAKNTESVEELKIRIAVLENKLKRMNKLRAENRRLKREISKLRMSAMAGVSVDESKLEDKENLNNNNLQSQKVKDEPETFWDWLTK